MVMLLPCWGCAGSWGLPRILQRLRSRERDLALAAIVARVLSPDSKLATARQLSPETASSSLGAALGLGPVSGNEMLAMLDWLRQRQGWIEDSLARRHLQGGTLVLYDVTSSYLEGRCCPLAAFGHNRDGKKSKKQIVFGLLCSESGCPVAVEVFAGNTGDPATVASQVRKLRSRFGIERIALVGDRGMLTTARIRDSLAPVDLDWISALKSTDLRRLLKPVGKQGPAPLRPDRLLPDAVAEIASPDFPGERLLVCLNPRLREERARKREDLLRATEAILEEIARVVRQPQSKLRGRDRINRRVGREANRRKVEKHFRSPFRTTISPGRAIRTKSPPRRSSMASTSFAPACPPRPFPPTTPSTHTNRSRKSSAPSETARSRGSRSGPSTCTAPNTSEPMSFSVPWPATSSGTCAGAWPRSCSKTTIARAQGPNGPLLCRKPKSPTAPKQKADTKITPDGLPVNSMRTLLDHLGSLTLNQIALTGNPEHTFNVTTEPTPVQQRAFQLLKLDPKKMFPVDVQAP